MKKINLLPVKKSLATAAASATFLAFSVVPALASNFTIEFYSLNQKTVALSIDSIDKTTGDFSGSAVNDENPDEIWEVTGTVSGNKVELELTHASGTKRIIATGTIQKDGVMEGRAASDAGELFEWEATDVLANAKNR